MKFRAISMELHFMPWLRARRMLLELAVIFFSSLVLPAIRVALSEPPMPANYYQLLESRGGGVNEYYDRAGDEEEFYLPLIRQIYARWPVIDLAADSASDKPPGYPFIMATAARIVGLDVANLRLLQLLLSAAIAALLYYWLRQRWAMAPACAILAPLVLSSFFVKSAAYLTTDHPALLGVASVLFLVLQSRWSIVSLIVLLICSSAVVCIRQDTLWLIAPIAVLLAGSHLAPPGGQRITTLSRLLIGGAILAPAVIVACLWLFWRGFVPPSFYVKAVTPGFSLTPLAYLLGVFALFWWPCLVSVHGWPKSVALARHPPALWFGVAGLAIALCANTEYNQDTGHWGGYLWILAAKLPAVAGRSLPFLLLAPLGALAIGVAFLDLMRENRLAAAVLGAAILGWAASCTANPYVFHRYYEPYVLVFLIALAALPAASLRRPFSLKNYGWLLLVGAGQLAITVSTSILSLAPAWRR